MRILQLGKYHWQYPGGLERCLGQMYENYRRPDYDADVDYVVLNIGAESKICRNGIGTVYMLGTFGKLFSTPVICPSRILSGVIHQKYDVIELHCPNPCMHLLHAFIKKQNPTAKTVIFWHSDISRQKNLKKLYKPFQDKLLRDAHKIFVTSPNYRDSSLDLEFVRDKCVVVPFGQKKTVTSPIPAKGKKLLSVGRLVYYKGFEYLIGAMADRTMKDYSLTIIGSGPLRRKLQKLVKKNKLQAQIKILAHVSEAELAKHYEECSVFILPSVDRAEAFGLVMLEAMSYGKPIITTSIGTGTDFIVKNGVNGRVVQPRSPEQLRMAIREMHEAPELMQKMGAASLERLATEFDIKRHFDTKHEVYKSLVNN